MLNVSGEEKKSHGYKMGSDGCQFYSQHAAINGARAKSLFRARATNTKVGSDAEGAQLGSDFCFVLFCFVGRKFGKRGLLLDTGALRHSKGQGLMSLVISTKYANGRTDCCVVVLCNSRGGVCPRRFFTHCGVILCVFIT